MMLDYLGEKKAAVNIIDAIEKGVPGEYFSKTISIPDRKQAIKAACQLANEGDIILIAGKGHETYQEIKGERFDFDDFKIIKDQKIGIIPPIGGG